MTDSSFLQRKLSQSLDDFRGLSPEKRASAVRAAVPDLHVFLDEPAFESRRMPPRTLALARSLLTALTSGAGSDSTPTLCERIVTDGFLRAEADRDQNVYLGRLFTRILTRAVPDLIFQPVSADEAARALRWARACGVPVTLRGAASTAMGGSVPNDAGLTLDLSRLDMVDVNAADGVCVIGAGARLRTIHAKLAEHGLALRSYPSNLGGTLVGWFVTGGIGLNAFGRGRALDAVRAADVLLPSGEHVRFHDDGRLDVPLEGAHRHALTGEEAAAWFGSRGHVPMSLADLAGSEGTLGLVLHLAVRVEPRTDVAAFLLSFEREADALAAAVWVASRPPAPANLKFFSGSHLHHTRRVWEDEDSRPWRRAPSVLSSGARLPWRDIVGPEALGASCGLDHAHAAAYLYVDFMDIESGRGFAEAVVDCPGSPRVLGPESVRVAAERFRPQQTKRLGPGLLAAEIVMPTAEVSRFAPRAARLAHNAGRELDLEVYYLADGQALAIAGYLTDHRSGAFALDLVLAPALLDLATRDHGGKPYVIGRWQAPYLERKLGREGTARLRAMKRGLDPASLLGRGVLEFRLRGALGALVSSTMVPAVGFFRGGWSSGWLAGPGGALRAMLGVFGGPARGRGDRATVGARFRVSPAAQRTPGAESVLYAVGPSLVTIEAGATAAAAQRPEDRALHCVNCGECNSVCPIFHESKIRLPQMLTHLGEAARAGAAMPHAGSVLLDLCMRCGNCEEVCQAGIPHLSLYERLQTRSDAAGGHDVERHTAIVAAVRGSERYQRDFLGVRPGGYIKRSPASLPGIGRYLVLRSEGDAGPAATCIHCGACVSVCPTHANREFEGSDPRWVTTAQERCIGCGTCVEVCPANEANGGQTLRVFEAPTLDWLAAVNEAGETSLGVAGAEHE